MTKEKMRWRVVECGSFDRSSIIDWTVERKYWFGWRSIRYGVKTEEAAISEMHKRVEAEKRYGHHATRAMA